MPSFTPPVQQIDAGFPPKLAVLFEPHRYKVLYGGRGGAKSWGLARALLIKARQSPIRVLCVREVQTSIRDSVHKLLRDQIEALGLGDFFVVERDYIKGANGSEFAFEGIKQNTQKIKSYEGIDICWAEEAHAISEESWRTVVPTIRKAGSEIWVSFNPNLESDATYQRFVKDRPTGAAVVKIGWQDNPWFPDVLRQEMEDLKAKDFDAYLNVWEGNCRVILEGAVYAQELRDMQAGGRITRVPYERSVGGVNAFFDLGWADCTSIWFVQKVGFETRLIDFYQNQFKAMDHYLGVVQSRGYIMDTLWLPHDARAKALGTGMSIEEQTRLAGFRVRIVPKLSLVDGINAARTIFPNCWIDEQRCAQGLAALRHYKYETDGGSVSKTPLHDDNSHAADAFRYLAIGSKAPRREQTTLKERLGIKLLPKLDYNRDYTSGWMR